MADVYPGVFLPAHPRPRRREWYRPRWGGRRHQGRSQAEVNMDPVLYVLAAAILVILIFFASRIRGRAQKDQNQQRNVVAAVGRPRPVNEDRPVGAPRMRRNLRNRVLARRLLEAEQEAQIEEEEAGNDHEEVQVLGKIGAKKQRKLDEKEQRKAQREAEEEEREERRKLQLKRDEDRKKDEERLRLEEKRKEEELKKAWEEKQRRDHEEYLKLKEAFTVEEEGIEVEPDENEAQDLLQDFINYIKSTKVVLLEDLASHAGLRTQDAINRLQDLIAEGTLTGVLDDRGKFIYITEDELAAVAQFIRQQGRISIVELAQASNTLINLNPESRSVPETVA